MPVNAPDISIDPYKSQVPLVQIPQEDLQRAQPMPEQAGYMGKAGSIMAVSDGLMKGMLKGLQLKEERKYKTAQAVVSAQDASIADAKKRYEDSLVSNGKDDPGTKAAWDTYTKVVNEAAEARQAFAVPEKGAKKSKDATKKGDKEAGKSAQQGGFAAGLKQFFERNPHVIPEIAIIGMKSQVDPSLYGQMTPELTARKTELKESQQRAEEGDIKLAELKKKQAAEDTYAAGVPLFQGLSSEQIAALPPDVKKNYDAWESAKAYLTPMKHSMATATYKMPDGTFVKGYIDDPPPDGQLYVPGATPKVGSESQFASDALKGYGVTDKTPPAQKAALEKYVHDWWAWKQAQTTTGTHEQLREDPITHKVTAVQVGSSTTKGSKPPQPPPGFAPLDENGQPASGGMQPPPQQSSPSRTASGKMTAPPSAKTSAAPKAAAGKGAITPPPTGIKGLRNTGLESFRSVDADRKIVEKQTLGYQKAETEYKKALDANQKEFEKRLTSLQKAGALNDATRKAQTDWLAGANAEAYAALEKAKALVANEYDEAIRRIGGTPGSEKPEDRQVTLPDGRVVTFQNKAAADSFKRDAGIK